MIGDPDGDAFALLGRLVEKIRRTLSVKHITDNDRHGLQIADQTVRERIEGDYSGADHTPIVVVDGREISWDDFGQMLMTFETLARSHEASGLWLNNGLGRDAKHNIAGHVTHQVLFLISSVRLKVEQI